MLAHGFWGGQHIALTPVDYWRGIEQDLRALGYELLITQVPPTAPVVERAERLCEQIVAWEQREGERVAVIGHSMGGLDARYAISKLGASSMVDTLLTVATPHRGSSVADLLMSVADGAGLSGLATHGIPVKFLSDMPGGGRCLTVKACAEFNNTVLDMPDVRYFSVGGWRGSVFRTSPELMPFYSYLLDKEGSNDGLVSLASARWGKYLATLDLDHFHQINFPLPHRWLSGAPSYQQVNLNYRWLASMATSPTGETSESVPDGADVNVTVM